jgi:hypothetical protein
LSPIISFVLLLKITANQNVRDCLEDEKAKQEKNEIAFQKELEKQFEMCEIDRQKKQKWLEDENSR